MSNHKKTTFRILKDGPIEVTGNFQILDPLGREIETEGPVRLCRCGGSRNKPFCDDTHQTRKFPG